MWQALRAELAYIRAYLLGALAISVGVTGMVCLLVGLSDKGSVPVWVYAFLPAMFLAISGMVVGFIAQGFRAEERRVRLLLAGPITPRQLAGVLVLLPAVLVGLCALAGGLAAGVVSLLSGTLGPAAATLQHVVSPAALMFAIAQLGPLAQESTAAYRQGRRRAGVAGWLGFALAIPLLVAFQWFLRAVPGIGQMLVAVTAMVLSAGLGAGRTDFTR